MGLGLSRGSRGSSYEAWTGLPCGNIGKLRYMTVLWGPVPTPSGMPFMSRQMVGLEILSHRHGDEGVNNAGLYPRVVAAIVVVTVLGVLLTGNVCTLLVPAALALGGHGTGATPSEGMKASLPAFSLVHERGRGREVSKYSYHKSQVRDTSSYRFAGLVARFILVGAVFQADPPPLPFVARVMKRVTMPPMVTPTVTEPKPLSCNL